MKLSVLGCFLQFCEHRDTIVRMDELLIGVRIAHQRSTRTSGNGLVGLVDVESLLALGIDRPENFLYVVRQLMELTLSRFENLGCFAMPSAKLEGEAGYEENYQTNTRDQGSQQQRGYVGRLKIGSPHQQEKNNRDHRENYRGDSPYALRYSSPKGLVRD